MKACVFSLFLVFLLLTGCAPANTNTPQNWGSFTAEATESHDGAYRATQQVVEKGDVRFVEVTVHDTKTGQSLFSFTPARASDFWGICWESDGYNLWIQSGDIGVACYQYTDGQWILNESVPRPTDIISKYD